MGKMSVDTYLKIVFYSYMPSSGHFYFGLTDELRIRDFMLNKKTVEKIYIYYLTCKSISLMGISILASAKITLGTKFANSIIKKSSVMEKIIFSSFIY